MISVAILVTAITAACPTVNLELRNGTEEDVELDAAHMDSARKGCVKYYGKGACLTRLIKSGERSYQAICRRGVSQ